MSPAGLYVSPPFRLPKKPKAKTLPRKGECLGLQLSDQPITIDLVNKNALRGRAYVALPFLSSARISPAGFGTTALRAGCRVSSGQSLDLSG